MPAPHACRHHISAAWDKSYPNLPDLNGLRKWFMIMVALSIAPLSFALTSARLISPQALRSSKPENRATCKELETPAWNSARKHRAHDQRQPLASPACECAYLMLKNLAIQSCHQRHEVRPWLRLWGTGWAWSLAVAPWSIANLRYPATN